MKLTFTDSGQASMASQSKKRLERDTTGLRPCLNVGIATVFLS